MGNGINLGAELAGTGTLNDGAERSLWSKGVYDDAIGIRNDVEHSLRMKCPGCGALLKVIKFDTFGGCGLLFVDADSTNCAPYCTLVATEEDREKPEVAEVAPDEAETVSATPLRKPIVRDRRAPNSPLRTPVTGTPVPRGAVRRLRFSIASHKPAALPGDTISIEQRRAVLLHKAEIDSAIRIQREADEWEAGERGLTLEQLYFVRAGGNREAVA